MLSSHNGNMWGNLNRFPCSLQERQGEREIVEKHLCPYSGLCGTSTQPLDLSPAHFTLRVELEQFLHSVCNFLV